MDLEELERSLAGREHVTLPADTVRELIRMAKPKQVPWLWGLGSHEPQDLPDSAWRPIRPGQQE